MDRSVWNGNLFIRLVGEGVFNLFYWMYFPYMAVYFGQEFGYKWSGIIMMIPPIGSLFGTLIGGELADRWGRKPVMLSGLFIQLFMFSCFAISSNSWLDYAAYLGIGFGSAIYGPAGNAMVADLVPDGQRKSVFAVFITVKNVGAVLGPLIGAVLFFSYRRYLLWTCTAVLLVYACFLYGKVSESSPEKKKQGTVSFRFGRLVKQQLASNKIIFTDRLFCLYIAAGVLSTIAIMQLDLYLSVYVTEHVKMQIIGPLTLEGRETLGWLLGVNGVLFVLFVLPVTHLLRHWQDRNVFILSCLLAGGGMAAVGLTENIWVLTLLTIIFTMGEIVRAPVTNNFVSSYAPPEARGKYMGASELQFIIGRILAPMTIVLSAWMPPLAVFGCILAAAMASMLFYILLFQRLDTVLNKEVTMNH